MQLNQIGKIIRIALLFLYPLLAVLIWFIPMFQDLPLFNKIAISALLGLYGCIRAYRLYRESSKSEEV
jgi:membrane protein DedA with SNARE-associated domain